MSLVETVASIAIGFIISLLVQSIIFPIYDIQVSTSQNVQIVLIFTVTSVIRGYCVRRFFSTLHR